MQCANCGARGIAGASTCYRCERPFEAASEFGVAPAKPKVEPPRVAPPAKKASPAPARRASRAPRLAPGATFVLAFLAVLDAIFLRDGLAALVVAALLVALGVALLRRRAWWVGVVTHSTTTVLALIAFLVDPIVGLLALLCTGAALWGLLRPRGRSHWRVAAASSS